MPGTLSITEDTKRPFSLTKLCTLVEDAFPAAFAYGADGALCKIMKYKCK